MHAGLAALVEAQGAALEGRRLLLYSYGSGLAASLWSVIGRRVQGKFALAAIARQVCCACSLELRSPLIQSGIRHLRLSLDANSTVACKSVTVTGALYWWSFAD